MGVPVPRLPARGSGGVARGAPPRAGRGQPLGQGQATPIRHALQLPGMQIRVGAVLGIGRASGRGEPMQARSLEDGHGGRHTRRCWFSRNYVST